MNWGKELSGHEKPLLANQDMCFNKEQGKGARFGK